MSAYMSRMLSRRDWGGLHHRLGFFEGHALSGSCDGFHVSCEDRINLYPAAPFRLATMLRAWTITEQGMGLIFWTAPLPSGHAVTHPTRQRALPRGALEPFYPVLIIGSLIGLRGLRLPGSGRAPDSAKGRSPVCAPGRRSSHTASALSGPRSGGGTTVSGLSSVDA